MLCIFIDCPHFSPQTKTRWRIYPPAVTEMLEVQLTPYSLPAKQVSLCWMGENTCSIHNSSQKISQVVFLKLTSF